MIKYEKNDAVMDLRAMYPDYAKLSKENIFAAERKYEKQKVTFSGTIKDIKFGAPGEKIAVTGFVFGNKQVLVHWYFDDKSADEILKLRKGKPATLVGTLNPTLTSFRYTDTTLTVLCTTIKDFRGDEYDAPFVCPYLNICYKCNCSKNIDKEECANRCLDKKIEDLAELDSDTTLLYAKAIKLDLPDNLIEGLSYITRNIHAYKTECVLAKRFYTHKNPKDVEGF